MHLGLVTYNLARDWNLETLIRNCEETGFEGVELRTTHSHGVELSLSQEERGRVRKLFQNTSVRLVGLGSVFEYHSPSPEERKRNIEGTKEYALLARDVGAQGIKVRPNWLPDEVPPERTLEQIGLSLRECAAFAGNLGVEVRLEVHGPKTERIPNIRTILDCADHPNLKVCWNSNPTDLEDGGFDKNFSLLEKDLGFAIHITEIFSDYPWRQLFLRLHQIGYSGYLLAEIPFSPEPLRLMKYYRALFEAIREIAETKA